MVAIVVVNLERLSQSEPSVIPQCKGNIIVIGRRRQHWYEAAVPELAVVQRLGNVLRLPPHTTPLRKRVLCVVVEAPPIRRGAYHEHPIRCGDLLAHPGAPALLGPFHALVDRRLDAFARQRVGKRSHPVRMRFTFLGIADEYARWLIWHRGTPGPPVIVMIVQARATVARLQRPSPLPRRPGEDR
ncbi:MAG TPA: hypothetical protein PLI48_06425 [Gammaproteobacteria bacterium]|uniref:hypothetical protein n=1 Tax=Thauera sp. TaxID=1905334 RepID=UPI002C74D9C7|nr:hypothetical protein [Thauera sp.]HRP23910.1 hypothetical protein [Thauera sp.]HRP35504.1 hypothetical protein [Gammaproteobacteria bacterium]